MLSDHEDLEDDGTFGTRDGFGAGDRDQSYRFGHRPRSGATYPFSTRQYVRLLVLRSRVQDGYRDDGDLRGVA